MRVKFEPRDLWLGAFIDTDKRLLYLCLVPCLPVILPWRWWTSFASTLLFGALVLAVLRVVGVHAAWVAWPLAFGCCVFGVWMATLHALAQIEVRSSPHPEAPE